MNTVHQIIIDIMAGLALIAASAGETLDYEIDSKQLPPGCTGYQAVLPLALAISAA